MLPSCPYPEQENEIPSTPIELCSFEIRNLRERIRVPLKSGLFIFGNAIAAVGHYNP